MKSLEKLQSIDVYERKLGKNNMIPLVFLEITNVHPPCFDCFTGKNWGFYSLGDKYDFLRAREKDRYISYRPVQRL